MTKLNSTVIKDIFYNPDKKVLSIEFHSKDLYNYFNVPSNVYSNFKHTESSGKWFNQEVKNKFNYAKQER